MLEFALKPGRNPLGDAGLDQNRPSWHRVAARGRPGRARRRTRARRGTSSATEAGSWRAASPRSSAGRRRHPWPRGAACATSRQPSRAAADAHRTTHRGAHADARGTTIRRRRSPKRVRHSDSRTALDARPEVLRAPVAPSLAPPRLGPSPGPLPGKDRTLMGEPDSAEPVASCPVSWSSAM